MTIGVWRDRCGIRQRIGGNFNCFPEMTPWSFISHSVIVEVSSVTRIRMRGFLPTGLARPVRRGGRLPVARRVCYA